MGAERGLIGVLRAEQAAGQLLRAAQRVQAEGPLGTTFPAGPGGPC